MSDTETRRTETINEIARSGFLWRIFALEDFCLANGLQKELYNHKRISDLYALEQAFSAIHRLRGDDDFQCRYLFFDNFEESPCLIYQMSEASEVYVFYTNAIGGLAMSILAFSNENCIEEMVNRLGSGCDIELTICDLGDGNLENFTTVHVNSGGGIDVYGKDLEYKHRKPVGL